MKAQRHVIKRQVLEFVTSAGRCTPAFQDQLSQVWRTALWPLLDQFCDELSEPETVHRIDRLEIDLGKVSAGRLGADLQEAFKRRFPRELHSALEASRRAGQAGMPATLASHLELVWGFAREGVYPWWVDISQPSPLMASLRYLGEHAVDPLRNLLKDLVRERRSSRRLLASLDDSALGGLLKHLLPEAGPWMHRLGGKLLEILGELTDRPPTTPEKRHEIIWGNALKLAVDLEFRREAPRMGLRQWIQAVAGHAGVPVAVVAARLESELTASTDPWPEPVRTVITALATDVESPPSSEPEWDVPAAIAHHLDHVAGFLRGEDRSENPRRFRESLGYLRRHGEAPLRGLVVENVHGTNAQRRLVQALDDTALAGLLDFLEPTVAAGLERVCRNLHARLGGMEIRPSLGFDEGRTILWGEALRVAASSAIRAGGFLPALRAFLEAVAGRLDLSFQNWVTQLHRDLVSRPGDESEAFRIAVAGLNDDLAPRISGENETERREAAIAFHQGRLAALLRPGSSLAQTMVSSSTFLMESLEYLHRHAADRLREILIGLGGDSEPLRCLVDSLEDSVLAGLLASLVPATGLPWAGWCRRFAEGPGGHGIPGGSADGRGRAFAWQEALRLAATFARRGEGTVPGLGELQEAVARRLGVPVEELRLTDRRRVVLDEEAAVVEVDLGEASEREPKLDLRFSEISDAYVANAGLVLLAPFLGHFFEHLELTEQKEFKDEAARHRAVGLLQHLVTEDRQPEEHLVPLNKILCGMEVAEVFEFGEPVSDAESEECGRLLTAAIGHASVLRNMSLEGFRGTFLIRSGQLSVRDDSWLLRVERETYDIVLERFPWSFNWIRLPWMTAPLRVEW